MDYKKSSLLLKKITSLYTTLQENEAHASSMEMQLMKSYLTDFYDAFVSGNGDTDLFHDTSRQQVQAQAISTSPQHSQEQVIQPPVAPQVISAAAAPITESAPDSVQPVVTEQPQTLQQPLTEAEISPVPAPEAPIVQEETPAPASQILASDLTAHKNPEAITDKETIVSAKELINQTVTNDVDADLIALFEDNPVNDLSDKLSMLPISDLTRALSINEKFFTIQQLFGGDSQAFEQTLQKLNSLSSFDEASEALIHSVASQYEWAAEAKKKKAEQFIKIVKRRYTS